MLAKLPTSVVAVTLLSAQALAQPIGLTQAELEALHPHIVPMHATGAGSGMDDLAFLDEFVAGARVVALGEPTHGAHEVFELKHRIVRYLIEEHGFTAIAMEANLPESRSVDGFIKGDGDDAIAALSELYEIWNTRGMLELVEWLRRHNETSTHPVSLHGIDVQSPWSAAREVLEYLEKARPDLYAIAQGLYAPALALEHDWNPAGLARVAPTLRRDAGRALDLLERSIDGGHAASGDEAWVLVNARAVVQLAESHYDNLPSRDQSMAENALRLLEDPDARIVLWAHNSHVIKAEPSRHDSAPMGAYLARALGDAYRPIGIAFSEGESRAVDPDTGTWVSYLLPLMPGTMGAELGRLGVPMFFLDIRGLRNVPDAAWLSREQVFRWAGAATRSTDHYLVPAEAFDGLVFFSRISPAQTP